MTEPGQVLSVLEDIVSQPDEARHKAEAALKAGAIHYSRGSTGRMECLMAAQVYAALATAEAIDELTRATVIASRM